MPWWLSGWDFHSGHLWFDRFNCMKGWIDSEQLIFHRNHAEMPIKFIPFLLQRLTDKNIRIKFEFFNCFNEMNIETMKWMENFFIFICFPFCVSFSFSLFHLISGRRIYRPQFYFFFFISVFLFLSS